MRRKEHSEEKEEETLSKSFDSAISYRVSCNPINRVKSSRQQKFSRGLKSRSRDSLTLTENNEGVIIIPCRAPAEETILITLL